jgi:hypothetical protein
VSLFVQRLHSKSPRALLFLQNEKGEEKMVIRVQLNDKMRELLNNPTSVVATISPVKTSFEMRLQDMSGVSRDLSKVSRSLLQFIDIATSGCLSPRFPHSPRMMPPVGGLFRSERDVQATGSHPLLMPPILPDGARERRIRTDGRRPLPRQQQLPGNRRAEVDPQHRGEGQGERVGPCGRA